MCLKYKMKQTENTSSSPFTNKATSNTSANAKPQGLVFMHEKEASRVEHQIQPQKIP